MRTVDEAIELLTSIPAGERDEAGNFPEGSINQLTEARLLELAEKQRAFSAPPKETYDEEAEEEGEAAKEEESNNEQTG